jgi:hypothetical protein
VDSTAISAGELVLCWGQVAAVNGAGQVAKEYKIGAVSSRVPKSEVSSKSQMPGMRKFCQ